MPSTSATASDTRDAHRAARMVEFTTALSDVETGLEPRRLVLVEKRSSSGRMWTVIGALIMLVMCFGAALLVVWHFNGAAEATVGWMTVSTVFSLDGSTCF